MGFLQENAIQRMSVNEVFREKHTKDRYLYDMEMYRCTMHSSKKQQMVENYELNGNTHMRNCQNTRLVTPRLRELLFRHNSSSSPCHMVRSVGMAYIHQNDNQG